MCKAVQREMQRGRNPMEKANCRELQHCSGHTVCPREGTLAWPPPGPQGPRRIQGKANPRLRECLFEVLGKKNYNVPKINQKSSGNNSSPMPLKLSCTLPEFFLFGACVYIILQTYPCSRCVQRVLRCLAAAPAAAFATPGPAAPQPRAADPRGQGLRCGGCSPEWPTLHIPARATGTVPAATGYTQELTTTAGGLGAESLNHLSLG